MASAGKVVWQQQARTESEGGCTSCVFLNSGATVVKAAITNKASGSENAMAMAMETKTLIKHTN